MSKSSVKTVLLILCLVLLAVCAILLFGKNIGYTYENADRYTSGDTTVTSPVENLDIGWTAGCVRIEYHTGSGIHVSESSDRSLSDPDLLRWWLDGQTLRIRYTAPGFRLFRNVTKALTVSLPEGTVLKSTEIGTSSGDLEIEGLAADEILLHTSSGSISASADVKNLTVSASSGSISFRQSTAAESVSLSTSSGRISASLANAKSIRANSSSGSISIAMTDRADSIQAVSVSGNVSAEMAGSDRAECSSTSGDVFVRPGDFRELVLRSTSGNVHALLSGKPGFTGEFSTTSGSFRSDLALEKNGNTYVFGDGSARCSIHTTSGSIQLDKEE